MKNLLLLLCLMALLGCAAPATPESAAAPFTVTDALGREVAFNAPPERIVIAGRANFMLSDAVYLFPQAPERVIALTQATQITAAFLSLLDADYEQKVQFTTDSGAEEILTARPDVVLLKSMMADSLGAALTELGIPVVYLDFETPEQYRRDLATLGELFADPTRARAIQSFYDAQLARVTAELADVLSNVDALPSVLVLRYNDQGGEVALQAPPAAWIQTQLTTLAGGEPVWRAAAQGGGWAVINFEQIAAWNPDVIFIINYTSDVDATVAALRADPQWQSLAATRAGRLYAFPKDYYSWDQPDTRWSLGLLWMASALHPERVTIAMDAAIYQFYATLYNLDAAMVDAHVLPRLEGDVFIAQP